MKINFTREILFQEELYPMNIQEEKILDEGGLGLCEFQRRPNINQPQRK